LTFKKAKQKRKLVLTPDFDSYRAPTSRVMQKKSRPDIGRRFTAD
jgi:hypothetical protein